MLSESSVIDCTSPRGWDFKASVKHYQLYDDDVETTNDTVTLIILHGAGHHKELFEPMLEELRDLQREGNSPVFATDAWGVDYPHHGSSSTLNDEKLRDRTVYMEDCVHSVIGMLKSEPMKDTPNKKLVFVGHSAGCVSGLLTLNTLKSVDSIDSAILLDPPFHELLSTTFSGRTRVSAFAEPAKRRRDIWESKEAAATWIATRPPCNTWDPRVLRLHVEFGLRPLPTFMYPDKTEGVTLACDRIGESFAYSNTEELVQGANVVRSISKQVPLYIFCGSLSPFRLKPGTCDEVNAEPNIKLEIADGMAHSMIQEQPRQSAELVYKVLRLRSSLVLDKQPKL